ncbi:hypothetical protein ACXU4B_08040 [Dyella soli]|uniref:Uncharacterized protein n=1 Tax=Dyella soli TaxID=522319 RepID=A0A4R0YVA7_9GAMM|nr:hypothetical protein [Dyella soli]TCI10913.1 hypothetical protein EZM97_18935 [Dyella soli]
MGDVSSIKLEGKDWLTEPEAACYCGVSLRKFQTDAPHLPIRPRRFMGKKLYEKAALYAAISNSPFWHQGTEIPAARPAMPISGLSPDLARRLRPEPLRPFKPRKKQT